MTFYIITAARRSFYDGEAPSGYAAFFIAKESGGKKRAPAAV
jgi:hypothetical protein